MTKSMIAVSVLAVGLTGAFFYFGTGRAISDSDFYNRGDEARFRGETSRDYVASAEPEESETPYAEGVVPKKEVSEIPIRGSDRAEGNAKGDGVQRILAEWPQLSRTTANLAIKRFGPPVTASPEALAWNKSGAWDRTEIFRTGEKKSFPLEHHNIIRQSVPRDVTNEQAAILREMDIGLSVAGKPTLLSSISESQESNFLAINLADDVMSGERTPEDARSFYKKTSELAAQGKSSPYTERILKASDKKGSKTDAERKALPKNPKDGARIPRSGLTLTEATGGLRIDPLDLASSRVEVELPNIAPDSSVRVLSGKARFRGDYLTDIVASAGTHFAFKTSENPPALHLELLEDHSEMLEVSVAGKSFLMQHKNSGVSITEPRKGTLQVATSGKVELILDENSRKLPSPGGDFVRNPLETPSGNWNAANAQAQVPTAHPVAWRVSSNSDGGMVLSDPNQGLPAPGPEALAEILEEWPDLTREMADVLVEKYGAPEFVSAAEIEWNNTGPWSKIIVRRTGMRGVMQHDSIGIVQQSVRYSSSRGKSEGLSQLHGDVTWSEEMGELTAIGDSEEENFLALNIADKFIAGKLDAAQARKLYEETHAKSLSGKSSPDLKKLQFKHD